ncbi:MAG: hypothetical protein CL949_00610 [Erythrobacter sp.]|nr:hypothetical protein [Erythrobacter sp.]|tara:strand:- start:4307 stop:4561 length:255 start_codon:yes stop_codon:yes gene_type:complete
MPILDPGIIAMVLALTISDGPPQSASSTPPRASPCAPKTQTTAFDCCVRFALHADPGPGAPPSAPHFTAAPFAQERMTGDADPR